MLQTLFLASQIAKGCILSVVESLTLRVTPGQFRPWQSHLA
jgi:hypothetical protein